MDATKVVQELLNTLPDSSHADATWGRCWNELDDKSQELVKKARRVGEEYLTTQQTATPKLPSGTQYGDVCEHGIWVRDCWICRNGGK